MFYVVRRPLVLLGESLTPGERVDGAAVPSSTLSKLVTQRRLVPDEQHEPQESAAPVQKPRGRPRKAAADAA